MAFIKQPSASDRVIMSTEIWLQGQKIGEDIAAIEELSDLNELSLNVDWSAGNLQFQLNDETSFDLLAPLPMETFSYGIQSTAGTIDVVVSKTN